MWRMKRNINGIFELHQSACLFLDLVNWTKINAVSRGPASSENQGCSGMSRSFLSQKSPTNSSDGLLSGPVDTNESRDSHILG